MSYKRDKVCYFHGISKKGSSILSMFFMDPDLLLVSNQYSIHTSYTIKFKKCFIVHQSLKCSQFQKLNSKIALGMCYNEIIGIHRLKRSIKKRAG